MDYKMIHYTVEKSIATITLDYAPTLNALDMNMSLEVESALHEAEADEAVKVVVLAGAGRAFSGGGAAGRGGLRSHQRPRERAPRVQGLA